MEYSEGIDADGEKGETKMKVSELIEMLQTCPQDAIVMYDFENAFTNEVNGNSSDYGFDYRVKERYYSMSVDDVLIGVGTLRGFVYLTEELIPVEEETGGDEDGTEL